MNDMFGKTIEEMAKKRKKQNLSESFVAKAPELGIKDNAIPKVNPKMDAAGAGLGAAGQVAQQANGGAPSAMSGAMSGAAAGTAILPGWGTAIGAAVGGISGGMAAKSAKKKADAQSDVDMYNKQSQIEGQTQLRRSAAIQSLAQNIGNTLLR